MAAGILAGARESARWRVADYVGTLPWADADDLAEQRRLLPESVYLRLHENRWTSSEDRLVSAADLAACVTLVVRSTTTRCTVTWSASTLV
jgi:hypothetical protein